MEIKLELWLRGYEFQTQTFEVPEHEYYSELTNEDGFEENVKFREALIKVQVESLKALYSRQIDKYGGRYQVYLIMPSKMDQIPVEDETKIFNSHPA